MTFSILFVGDIHLGRRPTGLPDDLALEGLDPASLTPQAAWQTTVAWACDHAVDAVVLAGDVVESLEDRFEACDRIERGVRELAHAGIPLLAVAGNHDVRALPRLAGAIDGFRLLGRGGTWGSEVITNSAGERVRILGWSFPSRVCSENPLDDLDYEVLGGVPTLGVLHCDLDKRSSSFAPVSRADLDRFPVDAWFLGHIHAPSPLRGPRPVGYLGSLVGLHPGEPGAHGPWLARVHAPGSVEVEQILLAPLRYERGVVSLEELLVQDGEDASDALSAALRSALQRIHASNLETLGSTRVVSCRMGLCGRSQHHPSIRRWLASNPKLPSSVHGDTRYFIEQVEDDGALPLDLDELSRASDPVALLARRLLTLESGGDQAESLVRTASRELELRSMQARWGQLDGHSPSDEEVRLHLLRAGHEALEELVASRNPDGAAS